MSLPWRGVFLGAAVIVPISAAALSALAPRAADGDAIAHWTGHAGAVNSVAFSPDGRRALSASQDATVRLWDVETGKELSVWKGHKAAVLCVAFSPDGRKGLSGGTDDVLRLWDGASGKSLAVWKGRGGFVVSAAFSPAGNAVLAGTAGGEIQLWDAGSGKLLATWHGHQGWVRSVSFSPDGRKAVSGGDDGTIRIWEFPSGHELSTWEAGGGAVPAVAFSPDGRLVASGGEDGLIKLWNAASGEKASDWEAHEGSVRSIAYSSDGRRLLSGGDDKAVKLWDADSGKEVDSWTERESPVSSVAMAPDGRRAVSGGNDSTVRLWALPPAEPGSPAAAPVAAVQEAADSVDEAPKAKTVVDPDAFAVVVGVENYRQKDIPPVEFASRDAKAMYDYLTEAMGFDRKNVVLLRNEEAGKTDMEKYLVWLKNRVGAGSRVLVYYAGHGVPEPRTSEGYLLPYDGDPGYTETTAFPLKRLYESLKELPSKDVTVVLDACFTGAGGRSLIAKGARPLVSKVDTEGAGANTVVLTATGSDQISTYFPEGQHGLFTYYLLKGLRGDADLDKDGRITTAELFSYVQDKVERAARLKNVDQKPTLRPLPGDLGERSSSVWVKLR